jgi:hypothetical protein
MQADFYESSRLSLVLSWVFCIPVLIGFIQLILLAFKKQDELPWIYTAWVSICFLILSPIRYSAFVFVLAQSYPFQSISAFFSVIWVWPWMLALVAFGIINFIGIIGPLLFTLWIAGLKNAHSKFCLVASAVTAPVTAIIGTFIFSIVLPFAAISTRTLDADAIIRATNGPARLVFLANGPGMIALPPYYSKTPQTTTDMIRSHVALIYLSNSEHDNFLKEAYPYLYKEFHEIVMKL